MFINSQNFDRRLSDPCPKFVTQLEHTKTGLTSYLTPRVIPKDEYVKKLEDSVFYELEHQIQNGIPLSPVNTNFVEPSDIDLSDIVTEKFDALRQSDIIHDQDVSTDQTDTITNN